jgi:hypothetical protein
MKKVFANWKMSLSALLLVGGLMFLSNNVQAQISSTPNAAIDIKGVTGSWALESDALTLLLGEMEGTIAQALVQLPSGGQQYLVWKYKADLYSAVYASISQGLSVSKAVRVNYDHLAGASHMEPVISPLSQTEWQAIFNELVDLLTT